jgi:oxygen-dependent protoporphyrinogen oxidase
MMPSPASGGSVTRGAHRLRVAIVGGGISGLACARHLAVMARDEGLPIEPILLEGKSRAGGVITTARESGFLIEGGPDCFISEKPWALDLCRRLGLGDDIIGTNPDCRRAYVLLGGRILPIPEGYQLVAPGRFLPFATTRLLSISGKLRAGCDLLLPRGPELPDESLSSFVRRRFGPQLLERLAQPLVAGIYNVDPDVLSLRATMPRFLEMEERHRSIILALLRARRGAAAARSGVSGARYSLFMTLEGGLESLIDRLLQEIPAAWVQLGSQVTAVAPAPHASGRDGDVMSGRYVLTTSAGERVVTDAVVLAMPAHAAADPLRHLDPELASRLASIQYGSSVTVNLAYRRDDLPRLPAGFGFVVPRSERRRLIACSISSVKFVSRAPAGTVLLRCFLGGPDTEGLSPDRLEEIIRDELREILGIEARPILVKTFLWPNAMAQYRVGHLDTVAAIESRLERHPGLALAGNGLRGVGVPDCVRSGEAAADRLAAHAREPG